MEPLYTRPSGVSFTPTEWAWQALASMRKQESGEFKAALSLAIEHDIARRLRAWSERERSRAADLEELLREACRQVDFDVFGRLGVGVSMTAGYAADFPAGGGVCGFGFEPEKELRRARKAARKALRKISQGRLERPICFQGGAGLVQIHLSVNRTTQRSVN